MKKNLFFAALAITALVSCSESDYLGDERPSPVSNDVGAISFNFNVPAITRGTAADAGKLNNQFIVWGEKSEAGTGAAASTGNLVFKNYLVRYTSNTAFTTTSNTENWEYVGISATSEEIASITPNSTTAAQTIKYWDYSAGSYTFTAVSALPADITSGRVQIEKIESVTGTGASDFGKGYEITLAKTTDGNTDTYPQLDQIFFSDRQPITQGTGTNRIADNAYGGNVTLTFRNTIAQVRAGVYETINGYDITHIEFYVGSGQATQAQVNSVSAFGALCPNVKSGNFEGTLKVSYYNDGAVLNQPKVEYELPSGISAATDLILGTNMSTLSTSTLLGKTATNPSWDTANGAFTQVLPQIGNTENLKLKVNYTLWNSVTGETINVTGATAEVPAEYLKWMPNYKYTYLFKISDNTNGHTGPGTDPAGLWPITFDAVVVAAENGQAEYITTVSEPSITTFGAIYDGSKYTSYQTGENEYAAQTTPNRLDIFATFMEGSAVKTPTLGGDGAQHVNVYKVTTTDDTNFPITEASVAEAIANPAFIDTNVDIYSYDGSSYTQVSDVADLAAGTTYYKTDGTHNPGDTGYEQTVAVAGTDYQIAPKITATNINSDATTNFTVAPDEVTVVPAEDGTTKTIDALKLTGVQPGTYAIEYEATSAWTGSYKKVYKIIVVQ